MPATGRIAARPPLPHFSQGKLSAVTRATSIPQALGNGANLSLLVEALIFSSEKVWPLRQLLRQHWSMLRTALAFVSLTQGPTLAGLNFIESLQEAFEHSACALRAQRFSLCQTSLLLLTTHIYLFGSDKIASTLWWMIGFSILGMKN